MRTLDDAQKIRSVDSSNLFEIVERTGQQLTEACRIGDRVKLSFGSQGISCVLACGLGGSAIGADFLRATFSEQLRIPLLVNRNYLIPGFVDSSTLVLASSYSGDTEETISAFKEARQKGARIVCFCSGGELERLALELSLPLAKFPAGYPPRTAMGYSVFSTLQVLIRLGLIHPGAADWGGIALETGRRIESCRRSSGFQDNPAKRLASNLAGRVSVIYGSQDGSDVVARRWAGQFSENAKQLAYFNSLPEMTHNEIVGWKHPVRSLKSFNTVFLRDREDHPRIQKRLDWVGSRARDLAGHSTEVWSDDGSRLQRLWGLVLLGDFVSLYLAVLNAEDPTPVSAIEQLKVELRRGTTSGT